MPVKLKFGNKNRNQEENRQEIDYKKILNKRIFIPKNIKLSVIGLLAIIILFSSVNAYDLSQKPTTDTETNTILTYSQNGNFNYKAYLQNNTVYDGKEYILPGQGKLFRKLVDNIEGSFSYEFKISNTSKIVGSYEFTATIETSQWTKRYTLINTTNFNAFNKDSYSFTEEFPINYSFYEKKVSEITNETGVGVQKANLIIKCNLQLTAENGEERVYQSLRPSINITLNENIIEISDSLSLRSIGSKTDQETIKLTKVIEESNMWTNISYVFLGLGIVFFSVTKTERKSLSKLEKKVRSIKKKYKEYIIEITEPLSPEGVDYIYVKSIDDLIRLSEEVGKPILFYGNTSESSETYEFFVVEEYTYYVFSLR